MAGEDALSLLDRIVRQGAVPRLLYRLRRLWIALRRPLSVGVRVLALDPQGRVLLVRHSYMPGWYLPGGTVDRGEKVAAAARRELAEETGLDTVPVLRLMGLYGRFSGGASDHVAVFVAEGVEGAPRADGLEILEAQFFPLGTLPAELSPATRRRLEEHQGQRPPSDDW